ncbi:hypothetical protein JB92DRAFT_2838613 [Gautieria morchelliformis]|nr:hypothetical protein JB92DRAFT_2838613 [Gautieria morchelliformis]
MSQGGGNIWARWANEGVHERSGEETGSAGSVVEESGGDSSAAGGGGGGKKWSHSNRLESMGDMKLDGWYKKKLGCIAKQDALNDAVGRLPNEPTSPVWRIQGLDPHADTPVEVLHVVLLGFVKYFWQDVVAWVRNAKRQELLEARVPGVDMAGLGISRLTGHTLVQWAGSLTGRDFRAICQVTLQLHARLDCLVMVPLIWQPMIEDSRAHLVELRLTIDRFLDCTLKWTPRQLGPTILFATEGFESFNAVICRKSVHSNRHTPSRDIALAFAQSNWVCHLTSGGAFQQVPAQSSRVDEGGVASPPGTVWRQASMHTLAMIPSSKTVMSYLGFQEERKGAVGLATCSPGPAITYEHTCLGQHVHCMPVTGLPDDMQYKRCKSLVLANSDIIAPGGWVIYTSRMHKACRIPEWVDVSGFEVPMLPPLVHMHNYTDHKCKTSGWQNIYQECQITKERVPLLLHKTEDDWILNLCQMRDARHFRPFWIPMLVMDRDHLIHADAAMEIAVRGPTQQSLNIIGR